MPRNTLPINETGHAIKTDAPGVPNADAKAQIPLYPAVVRVGGNMWNYAGLANHAVWAPPHATGWAPGYVPPATRYAMMRHHKVYQSENNLKNAIVGDGGRWIPCVNPYRAGEKEQFAEALKYTRFLEHCWRHMRGSNFSLVRQMLDCMREGNKVAAWSARDCESGQWKGKWILDRLQVLRNDTYDFYRDEFGNITHLRVGNGTAGTQQDWPREKFLVLTWRPMDDDPNGTSIYAPAYLPVYNDVQTDYEEMAYMATFGRPSVIVFAAPPPNTNMQEVPQPLYDSKGVGLMEDDPDNPGTERPRKGYQLEQNAILYQDFRAGSIWSMEYGAIVQVVEARPGGSDLFNARHQQNLKAIAGAIYGTHQVTESDRVVSTGNAEVGEGIAGLNVTEGKRMVEEAEENDIARTLIRLNFGEAALDLLPIRDYGSGQNGRMPKIMNAQVGFASSGAMDKAQYWDFCCDTGQPLPFPDSTPLIVQVTGTGGADKTGVDNKAKQPDPNADPKTDPAPKPADKTKVDANAK